jgi:hypothetical protein
MSGKNDHEPECEGIKQYRETSKEIKEIKDLMATMTTGNEVNKANLTNLSASFKELAKSNSLTHYKLFARTEKLRVAQGKTETAHEEHVKHGTQNNTNKQHRSTVLIAWVAIGVSLVTAAVLAKQAGLF